MTDLINNETKPHLRMGRVVLTVNDIDAVGAFYEKTIGLHLLSRDGETARYGAGTATLLELRQDKAARRRSPREAGLFHTAFLLPSRADLGRYIVNTMNTGTRIAGASDHAVSEAIYLQDPEGNGIEIYADRPADTWTWNAGEVFMSSERLDMQSLATAAGRSKWTGFPEGSVVGHVHLQVGALASAEAYYNGVLGLAITNHYPGATFYAADRYHHHIATNIWNSRGAAARTFPSTGLAEVQILIDRDRAMEIGRHAGIDADTNSFTMSDPWGTPVSIIAS